MCRRVRRLALVLLVATCLSLTSAEPAWAHGVHYIGTLSVSGDEGGTVSATTGQGVLGTEEKTDRSVVSRPGGCANAPFGMDRGYNSFGTPGVAEPLACVDLHDTTGSTAVSAGGGLALGGRATISGSGFRPFTAFDVTYLPGNDPGDTDADVERQQPTDNQMQSPFCHDLSKYPLQGGSGGQGRATLAEFTTDQNGTFGPLSVWFGNFGLPGHGDLCITSQPFNYKGPAPAETGPYEQTHQGQSVPIWVGPRACQTSSEATYWVTATQDPDRPTSFYMVWGDGTYETVSVPQGSGRVTSKLLHRFTMNGTYTQRVTMVETGGWTTATTVVGSVGNGC